MAVSQLPVRSHLTARRVFLRDYSIRLTVLPFFCVFLFSGISYVLQKKMKTLFTLYRWFFRLWCEPKDLKWWHSFLYQGVCNFFSLDHFSQNSHLYAKSFFKNLGWGMYLIIETEIVCFAEDFDIIIIVFQLQYL